MTLRERFESLFCYEPKRTVVHHSWLQGRSSCQNPTPLNPCAGLFESALLLQVNEVGVYAPVLVDFADRNFGKR